MSSTSESRARIAASEARESAAVAKTYANQSEQSKSFADEAKVYAAAANHSAAITSGYQQGALESAVNSKSYADDAKVSAQLAQVGGDIYRDIVEAQNALNSGMERRQFFNMRGVGNDWVVRLENINGIAVRTGDAVPSQKHIDETLSRVDSVEIKTSTLNIKKPKGDIVGAILDKEDKYALWFESGDVGFRGITTEASEIAVLGSASFNSAIAEIEKINERVIIRQQGDELVSAIIDRDGKVGLGFDKGLIDGKGLSARLINYINTELKISAAGKVSDAATAWLWRTKKAKYNINKSAKLKIGFTGDSWTEHRTIAQAMCDVLYKNYDKAGEGWIQFNIDGENQLNEVVLNSSGWDVYDASWTGVQPSAGCGIDGMCLLTNKSTATLSIANIKTTSLAIYYRNGTGSFRYRVDGNEWINIVGDGSNKPAKTVITGLSNAIHFFEFDTLGNTGSVVFNGFYATTNLPGVEIQKFGNGGITAIECVKILPYIDFYAKELLPDVLVIILGTNDYRLNIDVEEFKYSLDKLVVTYKNALPDSAIILVAPSQNGANGITPLSSFRDVIRDVSIKNSVEFFSLYDNFPDSYTLSNSQGLWKDGLHLSQVGARTLVEELNKYFL